MPCTPKSPRISFTASNLAGLIITSSLVICVSPGHQVVGDNSIEPLFSHETYLKPISTVFLDRQAEFARLPPIFVNVELQVPENSPNLKRGHSSAHCPCESNA